MTQACIALPGFVVVDPNGHGFAAAHDDHQAFAARDGGVYQVALKQDVVLGDDGDDDHRIFRELGFKGDELEMRTHLFVCYHSWEMSMFGGQSERKLARLQKLRIKLLAK